MLLTGCGDSGNASSGADLSSSKYVGTWKGQKATFRDTEVTVEEVINGEFVMVLNADGTADVTMADEKMAPSWKETNKGISVKGDDLNLEFEDVNGVLETDVIGVHFYLEKQ